MAVLVGRKEEKREERKREQQPERQEPDPEVKSDVEEEEE